MNLYFAPIETSLMRMLRPIFMLCAMLAVGLAQAATIVLEGNYQGKNLFVQNPYAEAGVGFCVFQVTVNDKVATDEINSSAFEVDLGNFNLKMGDKVVIKIMHKDGCTPKVLNPEVLKPKSTFDIVKQGISPDGTYAWTTTNESGRLAYVVQQKRWNKWIRVGEVMGEGSPGNHDYSFKVVPHSGGKHLPGETDRPYQPSPVQRERAVHRCEGARGHLGVRQKHRPFQQRHAL
jgi:hypothetical protein